MSGKEKETMRESRATECTVPQILLNYHRKRLSRADRRAVRRHLRRCPACRRDSRFVAIIVRDESRLIRSLEAFVPPRPNPRLRPSRSLAATVALLVVLLAFFIIPPGKRISPGAWKTPVRVEIAVSAAAPPRLDRLGPKPGTVHDRLVQSGLLLETVIAPLPERIPGADTAVASFGISQKRDRNEEFFGWSLACRPETESSYSLPSPG